VTRRAAATPAPSLRRSLRPAFSRDNAQIVAASAVRRVAEGRQPRVKALEPRAHRERRTRRIHSTHFRSQIRRGSVLGSASARECAALKRNRRSSTLLGSNRVHGVLGNAGRLPRFSSIFLGRSSDFSARNATGGPRRRVATALIERGCAFLRRGRRKQRRREREMRISSSVFRGRGDREGKAESDSSSLSPSAARSRNSMRARGGNEKSARRERSPPSPPSSPRETVIVLYDRPPFFPMRARAQDEYI